MTASMQPAPSAPPASAPAAPAPSPPISARDAASALATRRGEAHKQPQREAQKEPEAAHEEPVAEIAAENAEPVGDADPVEAAPEALDPPKLWTKEAKDRFAALDRETQEYLITQDKARETEIAKATTTVSEKDKALAKERQAIQQMRQQYEGALPVLLNTLNEQSAQFADIKTFADVERLASEDPARYLKWDAHQRKAQAVQQQIRAIQERNAQDLDTKWETFSTEQDKLLAEKLPEMADPAKAEKMAKSALGYLTDKGFTGEELQSMWNGKAGVSLRDARVQIIIAEATKFREAQEAAKKAKTQTVPPVQRPGVAQPRGAGDSEKIKDLSKTLDSKGSIKAAAALLAAKRAARRS